MREIQLTQSKVCIGQAWPANIQPLSIMKKAKVALFTLNLGYGFNRGKAWKTARTFQDISLVLFRNSKGYCRY